MGNDLKGMKAEKYYRQLQRTKTSAQEKGEQLKKHLKLFFSLEEASPGVQYSISVHSPDKAEPLLLIDPASADKLSKKINFEKFLMIDYYFEMEQPLVIKVNRKGVILSDVKTTIGTIFGSRNNTFKNKLKEGAGEVLSIQAKPVTDSNTYLNIIFKVKNLKDAKLKNVSHIVYYLISSSSGNKIYKSEPLAIEGNFNPTNIPIDLCKPKFTIEFFNYKHKQIFKNEANLDDFLNIQNGGFKEFKIKIGHGKYIEFKNESKMKKECTFEEYIQSGVRLGMDVAIDFTGSNGHPSETTSLHHISTGFQNDYETAIISCGSIIAQYDYDQLFPVFGFGACIRDNVEASMCFNITLSDNPYVVGVQDILNAYHFVLNNIRFSGPTYFAPLLNRVIEAIKAENNIFNYHILLILTDGCINDMDETISAIVEGSKLPLSIIIIGIGNADFTNMNTLDSDDQLLMDSNNNIASRDIVQFVPFNEFKKDGKLLAKKVLEEVPAQVVQFYEKYNYYPENIKITPPPEVPQQPNVQPGQMTQGNMVNPQVPLQYQPTMVPPQGQIPLNPNDVPVSQPQDSVDIPDFNEINGNNQQP